MKVDVKKADVIKFANKKRGKKSAQKAKLIIWKSGIPGKSNIELSVGQAKRMIETDVFKVEVDI